MAGISAVAGSADRLTGPDDLQVRESVATKACLHSSSPGCWRVACWCMLGSARAFLSLCDRAGRTRVGTGREREGFVVCVVIRQPCCLPFRAPRFSFSPIGRDAPLNRSSPIRAMAGDRKGTRSRVSEEGCCVLGAEAPLGCTVLSQL